MEGCSRGLKPPTRFRAARGTPRGGAGWWWATRPPASSVAADWTRLTRVSYKWLMQVTTRSVTATARRTQIVQAAIETLAEVGFDRASFAEITRRAGLSSQRLISCLLYTSDAADE